MNSLVRRLHSEKGFTLIELLVVIVIISILAVAVLAAINPLEQMRRARDTGKKGNARELLDAIERHVASQGVLPTNVPAADATAAATADLVTELTTALELKTAALAGAPLADLYITQHADESISICFLPESDKFMDDAVTRDLQRDGETGTCVRDAGDATDCHVCIPE